MTIYNLFGTLLKEKREQKNISLRELAKAVKITPTYLLYIEEGSKPPPSDKVLLKLANVLMLDSESKAIFFDIALKAKQLKNDELINLPADIALYLSDTDSAKKVIREADKLGYSNEFWYEILEQLKHQ